MKITTTQSHKSAANKVYKQHFYRNSADKYGK